ncbi:MAG: homoserine kinase [Actinomycetes bacterium]
MARPAFRAGPLRVRVPASSANLGPGFDAFGLALSLYNDVVIRVAESGLALDIAGEGADDLRRDRRNLVIKAMTRAFDILGGQPRGLEVVCANRIPQSRGLGSSAAAVVSGLYAARSVVVGGPERLDDNALLALASELEGHPDNVAACLYGGLTLAWRDGDGPKCVMLETSSALMPTVFVPATHGSTSKARRMLPESVPHADAATAAGRSALLVEAMARRPDLLFAATEDRLHQNYRAPAMPRSAKLMEKLRAARIPAVISGAGPTVLALTSESDAQAAAGLAGTTFEVRRLEIDREGARVLPIDA